ncbi:MAG TPA: barstar family protein [Rhodanobacteraceae bacterium]|nr:barstar family protein [Rhodanobacteraceae bacterium]
MNTQGVRIDLTDMASCGVYFVTPEDIDTLATGADRDHFNVHHVDLADCRDRATFAERLAAGLSLPASYGRDWPALAAYLQNMDGLPSRGHIVLVTHPGAWRQADPDGLDAVLDTLEEIAAIWAGEGVAFFVFLAAPVEAAMPAAST